MKYVSNWFEKQWDHLFGSTVDEDLKKAYQLLEPSIQAVMLEIKSKGAAVVEAAAKQAAADAAAVLTGDKSASAAGSAAVATLQAAGKELANDAAHALATAIVTAIK